MLFSVVIPLYNKAPYVAKAINSVLSQTNTDYEIIVVDDGSKDESSIVAAEAIEGHANCRLVRQENAGVSMARNNGVALSRGDYLCFLDADDWWEPTFLEEMEKLIEEFPDAGIYGTNYTIVNENKHKTRIAKIGVDVGFESGCVNYCKVYASTMYMPLWTGAVCVPRKVFDEMQGFPMGIKLGEDFMLWIHIALKYKVAFLNKPLAYYNQDVDVVNRGVGKIYEPKDHMLWNLVDLEPLENTNEDYKYLVDKLRVTSLMPYYLEERSRSEAIRELDKVDWSKQSVEAHNEFNKPIWYLKIKYRFLIFGSRVKQMIYKTIKL